MNAIFALALLASSSWAGVVAPVESGAAPAGPSMTAVPVLTPAGGGLAGMTAPGSTDLRGALPALPAPVPGLIPSALRFVGETPDAAAAQPEAAAASAAPARPVPAARPSRAADATPALPGRTSPGAPRPAVALDRKAAGSTALDAPSAAAAEGSAIEHAAPEKAAGFGRSFFDQSSEKRRGSLAEGEAQAGRPSRAGSRGASAGTRDAQGLAVEGPYRAAASRGVLFGAAGAPALTAAAERPAAGSLPDAARRETLRDAVASFPGAAPAGSAILFRAAAPNGELGASAAPAAVPLPGAPHPLSLDLSGLPLIVRVRAALGGAVEPVRPAAPAAAAALPARGPSTALLERGAMLEAFSVAGDFAARSADPAASALQAAYDAARTPRKPVPAPESSQAPLWWAWFFLPLFVAAARGVL